MTSAEIRQSFLDFFQSKERQHTIVPSSSLLPDSPNLLFTNAGMNQFVPIFLGQTRCPYSPGRAADTQKCIRAGGKHNDLEDVGLDTYHHTFFEMLGNWSFGDYFKREAIEWAWELITVVWKFPKDRLYATVYCPHMDMTRWGSELKDAVKMARIDAVARFGGPDGIPQDDAVNWTDDEAAYHWARLFLAAGIDPETHIVPGGKKDNFWMMGDTGPCGPCSELHVDLTPGGDTKGALVNKGSAQCIEIWNLVFMQFNANPDGTFSPLPAKSVDTGMGFERVTGIIQNTRGFTDFSRVISNYETDIFRPIFDQLSAMSGKPYCSTLPAAGTTGSSEQEKIDVAFRVIADHIRTLSFAIADGIQPGNTDRNYVLRRILRRAVRYGRTLGLHDPFFYKLVDVLADKMGDVFPELRARQKHVQDVIRVEEEAFNRTLDTGIAQFNRFVYESKRIIDTIGLDALTDITSGKSLSNRLRELAEIEKWVGPRLLQLLGQVIELPNKEHSRLAENLDALIERVANLDRAKDLCGATHPFVGLLKHMPGPTAFELYDTYGFPLDLTELMARERGLTVDVEGFHRLMEEQRERARKAQKKTVIELSQIETQTPTTFVGFEQLETPAKVLEVVQMKDKLAVILDTSSCYAEMGGQVGDTGELALGGRLWRVNNTQKSGPTWLHFLDAAADADLPPAGASVTLTVDRARRAAIQRHHTVTHLLHWALHEVVSRDASQKGSFVGPDKLTFDFNAAALTPTQIADVEKLVNERILENAPVSWTEVKYNHVKDRKEIMQFFGDKYGDWVRVVQIGGKPTGLDGYSMELCGGTHCRAVGEIGLFRIVAENAIASGVRRIEAIAGLEAWRRAGEELAMLKTVAARLATPVGDLDKKIENLLAQQKELEREVKVAMLRNASNAASELLGRAQESNGVPFITHNLGNADADFLQAIADSLKGRFKGVVVLGGSANEAVTLIATVSAEFTAKVQAGKIIQQIAPIVGGKGGGKPDNARGGGKDVTKLDEALAKARSLF